MIEIYINDAGNICLGAACDKQSIFCTAFATSERETLKKLLKGLPYNVHFQVMSEPSPLAKSVFVMLRNAYDGKGISEKPLLRMEHLPAYTRKALEAITFIPLGYVTSYSAVAKIVGGSARTVGNAMSKNPFAPIVPCHRVVAADFTLGGYGGGVNLKLELLKREKRGYRIASEVPIKEKKLKVFPVEFVLNKLRDLTR